MFWFSTANLHPYIVKVVRALPARRLKQEDDSVEVELDPESVPVWATTQFGGQLLF